MKDFFISYNHRDEPWAEWIAWILDDAGYSTVLQKWHFRPGQDFVLRMQKAMRETRQTIIVLSQDYLDAEFTQREWAAAVANDPTSASRSLIPIRVARCHPDGMLRALIAIDFVGLGEKDARDALLRGLQDDGKPATAPDFPAGGRTRYPGRASSEAGVWREKVEFLREQENEAVDVQALRKQLADAENRLEVLQARSQRTGKTPRAKATARPGTPRFLRRRCRVMPGDGTFRTTVHSLLSHQYAEDAAGDHFQNVLTSLAKGYERRMAEAAYLETLGRIEEMCEILKKGEFEDPTLDDARRLYLALAYEKLDHVAEATGVLRPLLELATRPDIVRAAQFNLQVCYEKSGGAADFTRYIEDTETTFVDGERLSDKAIAMHLIVCIRNGKTFTYKRPLQDSLDFLFKVSKTGWAKSLLTMKAYEAAAPLTDHMIETILNETTTMDRNSRVAVLVTLRKYLPEDHARRQEVATELKKLSAKSTSTDKWLKSVK